MSASLGVLEEPLSDILEARHITLLERMERVRERDDRSILRVDNSEDALDAVPVLPAGAAPVVEVDRIWVGRKRVVEFNHYVFAAARVVVAENGGSLQAFRSGFYAFSSARREVPPGRGGGAGDAARAFGRRNYHGCREARRWHQRDCAG